MRIYLLVSLLYLLSFIPSRAQSHVQDSVLAYSYLNQAYGHYYSNPDSFEVYMNRSIPLMKKIQDWDQYLVCLNTMSFYFFGNSDFENIEKYTTLAYKEAIQYLNKGNINRYSAFNNYGFSCKEKGDYDQAIRIYKESIENLESPIADYIITNYLNISTAYRFQGDYDQAISYLEQALLIKKDSVNSKAVGEDKLLLDLGHNYRDKDLLETAKKSYQKCLDLIDQKNLNKNQRSNLVFAYQSMAQIYYSENKLDSSQFYIQKAISNLTDEIKDRQVATWGVFGNILLKNQEYEKALNAYQKANQAAVEIYKAFEKNEIIARTFKNVGITYLNLKKPDLALNYLQKALIELSIDFENKDIKTFPKTEQMLRYYEGLQIVEAKAKTFLFKYENDQNLENVELAFSHYQYATDIIAAMRNNISTPASKNDLAKRALSIYEGGIHTAFILTQQNKGSKYAEAAWQFSQQNKARLLAESLKDSYAKIAGNIPEEELKKELKLRQAINVFTKKINREKSKPSEKKKNQLKDWEQQLFSLKIKYDDLLKSFETRYQQYYELKYANQISNLASVRKKLLTESNSLIEYFVGNEDAYVFCITKDDFKFSNLKNFTNSKAEVKKLVSIIKQAPFGTGNRFAEDRKVFIESSQKLFEELIEPVNESLSEQINQLIIIPDDILAYLPFEVLIKKILNPESKTYSSKSLDYLLNHYTISYNYSTNLLLNHTRWKPTKNQAGFLGFAPSFQGDNKIASRACSDNNMYSLQCSEQEVESIFTILDGKVFKAKEATTSSFKELAPNCRILHLATHACIDEDNPEMNKIYLADHFLTSRDLENTSLNAELAVLSACNTGSGKLVKGEGVMSLSKSFTISGCASNLMTLWSVDDCSTSDIMIQFYKNLKSGATKDQALQQAKLTHLQNADKVLSHPFYWAAIVQSGNTNAMDFSNQKKYWFIFIFLFGIGTIFLYYKRKK